MKKVINKLTNSFWFYTIPIFIIFLLILLTYYPGILVSDSMFQWHQTQTGIIDNWHPAYNTIYIMFLTKIWNNPFFVLMVQSFIIACIVGYFLNNIKKYYNVNKFYLFICSIIFALIPLNYNTAIILLKDGLYSAMLILLSAEMIKIINTENYFKKIMHNIFLFIIMLVIMLFRHNGIYTLILFDILLILFYKKEKIVYAICFSSIICYILLTSVGFKIFNISEANYANKYAPISHIIARMLNDDSIYFSKKDMEFLEKYVDTKKLKDTFNKYNMDYSIATQNSDALKKEGKEYLLFGIKKIFKYPLTFVKHYAVLDSFLFNPIPLKGEYFVGMFIETDLWMYKDIYPELNENSKIPFLLPILKKCSNKFQTGLIGIITMRPAIYLYITIITIIYFIKRLKNKKIILVGAVSLFNLFSLAPAIPVAMTRYVYSTIALGYLFIIWILYDLFCLIKSKIKSKNKIIKNN